MKCPFGDVKTNYRTPLGFIKHMKKKHGIDEKQGMQIYAEVLKICPPCYKVIPFSCIGCLNCGEPLDERMIEIYEAQR